MRYTILPILIAAILLLLSACGSVDTSPINDPTPAPPQEAKSSQLAVCPVTQPPAAAFIPPEPWPSQPPRENHFWLGDRGLWTSLPADGSWGQLALGEKFFWWSDEFDVTQDDTPDLQVTARHLDGDSPAFQKSEATNAYHESLGWAMLVGVELASPGCWEFTGQYNNHQLSFVVWVPEA